MTAFLTEIYVPPAGTAWAARLILLCFLLCPWYSVEAREISFEEAGDIILSASSELTYARSALRVTSSQMSPLITDRIPFLSFSYTSRDEYEKAFPFSPYHSLSIGAEMELMDGGRTHLKNRLQHVGISETRLELRKIENTLIEKAAEIFSSALIAEKQLSLLEKSYTSAFRHLETARRRHSQGKITRDELLKNSLKVRELGLSIQKAELSLLGHRNSLLSLSGGEPLVPEGTINADYPPLVSTTELSVQKLADYARLNSPDSIESSLALKRTEISAAQESRRYLPSLSLFSNITFTGSEFPPVTPEVTLGFTMLSRGEAAHISYTGSAVSRPYGGKGEDAVSARFPLYRSRETRQLRKLELARQRRENSQVQKNLELRIEERYRNTELLESGRDLLKTSLAIREREHSTIELLYKQGHVRLSELLDSRRELTEARIELLKEAASLFLSEYRLLLYCGMERRAASCAAEFFHPAGRSEEAEGTEEGEGN